jgi:DNA-binding Lrp family transcriptional regulator
MGFRLDEIDRRVIYALMEDARTTSAPDVAEAVNVSPGTIRNRINRLEDAGVITGYRAEVDFERADGRLTNLYICNAPLTERETLAAQVRAIPGVINVRELMAGRRNLHVLAVGEDTADLRRIAKAISSMGIEIEEEDLVRAEATGPYTPYGPEDGERRSTLSDFISLAGGSEIAEVTVPRDAPIAGRTIADAASEGLVDEEVLIIAIEREEDILTPRGETTIEPDDLVTLFSRGGVSDEMLSAFKPDG